jgi:hypothetical protein
MDISVKHYNTHLASFHSQTNKHIMSHATHHQERCDAMVKNLGKAMGFSATRPRDILTELRNTVGPKPERFAQGNKTRFANVLIQLRSHTHTINRVSYPSQQQTWDAINDAITTLEASIPEDRNTPVITTTSAVTITYSPQSLLPAGITRSTTCAQWVRFINQKTEQQQHIDDVVTGDVIVSLIDPVAKTPIRTPVAIVTCSRLVLYDESTIISLQSMRYANSPCKEKCCNRTRINMDYVYAIIDVENMILMSTTMGEPSGVRICSEQNTPSLVFPYTASKELTYDDMEIIDIDDVIEIE